MNAYELAKQLEERHAPYEDDAANMLRQQADRIAELKWEINHLEQSVDFLRTTLFDIKQKYDTKNKHYVYTQVYVDELQAKIEALQFPPQTKPLSDEEIAKEWSKFYPDVFHTHLIDFVRAIEERHGIK